MIDGVINGLGKMTCMDGDLYTKILLLDIMENGSMVRNTEWAYINIQMEIFIKDNLNSI